MIFWRDREKNTFSTSNRRNFVRNVYLFWCRVSKLTPTSHHVLVKQCPRSIGQLTLFLHPLYLHYIYSDHAIEQTSRSLFIYKERYSENPESFKSETKLYCSNPLKRFIYSFETSNSVLQIHFFNLFLISW